MTNNKKSTGFVFDLVCNLTVVAAAIVLIVALCLAGTNDNVVAFNVLITIGCGVCAIVALAVVIRAIIVLFSKINHRSPEYKNAIVRTVVMGLILIVSVIGFVWALMLLI